MMNWLVFTRVLDIPNSRILVHPEHVNAVAELGDGTAVLKLGNGDQVHVRESWEQVRVALTRARELRAVEAGS